MKILRKEAPSLGISESLFSDNIPTSETGYHCEKQGSILVLSENNPKEVPLRNTLGISERYVVVYLGDTRYRYEKLSISKSS